jgi:NitT/TauT family transport system permease protein
MKRHLFAFAGLALFLAVWELVPAFTPGARGLLPVPSQLPGAFWRELQSGVWLACVGASLSHYLVGLLAGVTLGVAAGVATGVHPPLEWATAWVTRVLRPIPGLAWIPFAILWFGVEEKAAVFIISIGVFWIVYFSAHGAIRNVDRDLVEVAAAFGFKSVWERLVKIQFPASLPGILVGVRTSLGQAWMAVVAAELFGVAGLGQRMNQASSLLATDIVVVYMLTMATLYGVIDTAFMIAQSRLLTWKA